MDPSSTTAITEFATVVAGFTGLVLAIGSREGATDPFVKYRTVTMLFYAFTAAFGSLLPTMFQSIGMGDIWAPSAASLAILLIANMAATIVSSCVLLSPDKRPQLAIWMWALVLIGNSVFCILLLASLFDISEISVTGAFFGALIWQLVLSTILFTRIVLESLRVYRRLICLSHAASADSSIC